MVLEIEDERLEVRSRTWPQVMARGSSILAHLVPVRRGVWLPAPGWLEWPFQIGPNMRRELKQFQPNPIQTERQLQSRTSDQAVERAAELPRNATLAEAVARMVAAAEAEGRPGLVMSAEEWQALVLKYLGNLDSTGFSRDVVERAGSVDSVSELNRWLALATHIWNTTPQPDRGGKSAYDLVEEQRRRR